LSDAIGVGVIGLGFMGRIHVASYAAAKAPGVRARLVAVADQRPGQLGTSARGDENLKVGEGAEIGPDVRRYSDAAELLRDPDVELVSICTPTDTHADVA